MEWMWVEEWWQASRTSRNIFPKKSFAANSGMTITTECRGLACRMLELKEPQHIVSPAILWRAKNDSAGRSVGRKIGPRQWQSWQTADEPEGQRTNKSHVRIICWSTSNPTRSDSNEGH